MTIITKPISDKKIDKLEVPLVENDQLDNLPSKTDVEAVPPIDAARFVVLRARARKVSTTTTLCLLLTALMVVSIGIVGGTYLYRQYIRAQMHRFRGRCLIPYGDNQASVYMGQGVSPQAMSRAMVADSNLFHYYKNKQEDDSILEVETFFEEKFDLDLENNNFEKIDVPDFRDGRRGRFIHDFNANVTGIIDTDDKRCFVMPLNRRTVLPPRSLFDLIQKIWDGYYKVDTEVVRETMRVVTPPITDIKSLGPYLSRECDGLPVYKLEKYESGVYKRSADLENGAKFAQFSGKTITEFDIINFAELLMFEKNMIAE